MLSKGVYISSVIALLHFIWWAKLLNFSRFHDRWYNLIKCNIIRYINGLHRHLVCQKLIISLCQLVLLFFCYFGKIIVINLLLHFILSHFICSLKLRCGLFTVIKFFLLLLLNNKLSITSFTNCLIFLYLIFVIICSNIIIWICLVAHLSWSIIANYL
jgi:hypothetical protein